MKRIEWGLGEWIWKMWRTRENVYAMGCLVMRRVGVCVLV